MRTVEPTTAMAAMGIGEGKRNSKRKRKTEKRRQKEKPNNGQKAENVAKTWPFLQKHEPMMTWQLVIGEHFCLNES
jgi:hypothetical protein